MSPIASVMSAQESPPIINPNVYLNYLSTGEATIYEVGRGINLATLGVRCVNANSVPTIILT